MYTSRSLNRILVPQILLILISGLLFNGCAIYYPQTTDIPLIKEKKELRVDGGISLFPAINGTVSYGLTDKIAVQLSGNLMPGAAHYSNPLFQYLINGAVGYYKYNPTNNWTKELYVGIGNGYSTVYDYTYHSGTLLGNYQVYYVQGNIGRRGIKHKFFEYAFGLKLGLMNSHFAVQDVYDLGSPSNGLYTLKTGHIFNKLIGFIEPAFSIKLGSDRLMFNIKPSFCYMKQISNNIDQFTNEYTHYDNHYNYPYLPFGIGFSLNYRFSK